MELSGCENIALLLRLASVTRSTPSTMSVNQDSTARTPKPSDLDSSDGLFTTPKTQAQYKKDVKTYLGAARATLQNMTGAALEDTRSDPDMDPAYFGCIKELLRLNRTLDGGEKSAGADADDEGEDLNVKKCFLGLPSPAGQYPATSCPRYAFTIHFLPRGLPDESNRHCRPPIFSALCKMMPVVVAGPRKARELSFKGGYWMIRGDLIVLVSDNFDLPGGPLQIVNFPLWLMVFLHLPTRPTICYRRQGTIRHFLCIHGVLVYLSQAGDWSLIRSAFLTDTDDPPNGSY